MENERDDPSSYLCVASEKLRTIYKRGKKAKGDWLKEKKKQQGRAFTRKPSALSRSDSSAAASSAASSSALDLQQL